MSAQRPKWWEIATEPDQIELFHLLARNPAYEWRSADSLLRALKWDEAKFRKVITPFLKNRVLILKKTKKALMLGYWERVDNDPCNSNDKDCKDDKRLDPNII